MVCLFSPDFAPLPSRLWVSHTTRASLPLRTSGQTHGRLSTDSGPAVLFTMPSLCSSLVLHMTKLVQCGHDFDDIQSADFTAHATLVPRKVAFLVSESVHLSVSCQSESASYDAACPEHIP